jgi:hypothetical protein
MWSGHQPLPHFTFMEYRFAMPDAVVAVVAVVAARAERPGIQAGALGIASPALLVGLIYLNTTVSSRQGALWVVGGLLCLVLYHVSFGFTSAWRRFIGDRCGAGLRVTSIMSEISSASDEQHTDIEQANQVLCQTGQVTKTDANAAAIGPAKALSDLDTKRTATPSATTSVPTAASDSDRQTF